VPDGGGEGVQGVGAMDGGVEDEQLVTEWLHDEILAASQGTVGHLLTNLLFPPGEHWI
jgi:hypothetical protein